MSASNYKKCFFRTVWSNGNHETQKIYKLGNLNKLYYLNYFSNLLFFFLEKTKPVEVQIEQYSPKGNKEIKYLAWNYFPSIILSRQPIFQLYEE